MGSYRLEERLGQGGMGEVWRARHRMLARPAAIKLIRPAARAAAPASEELQRRFEREAQAIARLRSPHTVELFDFGVAADGAFYYVMELLDGLDADALVRRHGPLPQRARRIRAAAGVPFAERGRVLRAGASRHQAGQHLPLPVRRGPRLREGAGLRAGEGARRRRGDRRRTLTAENLVQGTPAFIAPEQALGGARVDGRADIYATGCVAYWLLTGQYVFTGDTPMAILMHHVQYAAGPAVDTQRAADPAGARAARARLPGEGSGGSAADRARAVAQAGGSGSARALERVTGAGVVDAARGGRRQRVRSETPPRTGVAGFTSPPCRMFPGAPWSEE